MRARRPLVHGLGKLANSWSGDEVWGWRASNALCGWRVSPMAMPMGVVMLYTAARMEALSQPMPESTAALPMANPSKNCRAQRQALAGRDSLSKAGARRRVRWPGDQMSWGGGGEGLGRGGEAWEGDTLARAAWCMLCMTAI